MALGFPKPDPLPQADVYNLNYFSLSPQNEKNIIYITVRRLGHFCFFLQKRMLTIESILQIISKLLFYMQEIP